MRAAGEAGAARGLGARRAISVRKLKTEKHFVCFSLIMKRRNYFVEIKNEIHKHKYKRQKMAWPNQV